MIQKKLCLMNLQLSQWSWDKTPHLSWDNGPKKRLSQSKHQIKTQHTTHLSPNRAAGDRSIQRKLDSPSLMQRLWLGLPPSPSGQTALTLPHTADVLEECKHKRGTRQHSVITNTRSLHTESRQHRALFFSSVWAIKVRSPTDGQYFGQCLQKEHGEKGVSNVVKRVQY